MRASSCAPLLRFPAFVFRFLPVTLVRAIPCALLAVATASNIGLGDINSDGHWMGPWHAVSRATHMTLLRRTLSVGVDSSLVLYWHSSDSAQVLLYKLADFQGSGPRTARASAASMDIFCSGHSTLADGKLIVVSGTLQGENGDNRTKLFDPNFSTWPCDTCAYPTGSNLWAESDTFKFQRWYPSVRTLSDGTVLTLSGFLYKPALIFGGTKSGGSAPWIKTLALTNYAYWSDGTAEDVVRSPAPSLSDHTSIMTEQQQKTDVRGSIITFGGLNSSGAAQNTVWQTWHHAVDPFNNWESDSIAVAGGSARPAPRSQHGAVIQERSSIYSSLTSYQVKMFVFGGLDAGGNALDDAWLFNRADNSSAPTWTQLTTSGTPPGPRYGHSCVYDPGPDSLTGSVHPRMLVFGGKINNTTFAGDTVFQLTLGPSYVWSVAATGGPSRRYRHAAIFDQMDRATSVDDRRHMVIFGGLGTDSLLSDTWQLGRVGYGGYTWYQVSGGLRPSPRYKHSLVQDREWDRLIVFGGDSTSSGDRVRTAATWSFYPPDSAQPWAKLAIDGVVDPTSGHAAIYYTQSENARIPEHYDPAASAGSRWAQYTAAPKWDRDLYPFLFQLPSGHVFYAGKNDSSAVLDLGNISAGWTNPKVKSQLGGAGTSAVMYEPGKVMQTGNKFNSSTLTSTLTIDYSSGESGSWQEVGLTKGLVRRANLNLTILPTGDVLATGGHYTNDQGSLPRLPVQVWSPATGQWSDTLASEPVRRGYHSTAILLPDARVMCAGGDANDDRYNMTIYEPPYLFRSGGYAARPVISSAPDRIVWGETYTVGVDSTSGIGTLCLIRPGAATHAFNQNQLYVPLTFSTSGSQLCFTAPSSGTSAPPGDYLLFVVDNSSERVPSVARWVRVGEAQYQSGDTVRPGGITNLSAADGDECVGVDVGWTAQADDSTDSGTGKVRLFDLRYKGTTICDNCWSAFGSATQVTCEPTPIAAGSSHGMTVTGLVAGSYYLRMVSYDDKNSTQNMSAMSNAVSVQVYSCDEGLVGGGGGGGGSLLGPAGAYLATAGEGGERASAPETPLLPGIGSAGGTDFARLVVPPTRLDSTCQVRLRRGASGQSELRILRLHALDTDPSLDVFRTSSRWLAGTRVPAEAVHSSDGQDVSAIFAGDDRQCFVGSAGDTALVQLPQSSVPTPVYLRIRGRGVPNAGGIAVQSREVDGRWVTSTRFIPRGRFAEVVLDSIAGDEIRLVPEDNIAISSIGRVLEAAESPTDRVPALRTLRHSRLGSIEPPALTDGGAGTTLAARDTLWSEFADIAEGAGTARVWYLELTGSADAEGAAVVTKLGPEPAASPAAPRFALEQNRPNPFSSETEIAFTLPRAARVQLEVFDLAGRRVRSLVNRTLEPGRHTVGWDRQAETGGRLAAGIYLYRLSAGDLRAERKLVLFP